MIDSESDGQRVAVIGAACVDIKGQAQAPIVRATSNPGIIRIGIGGVGRNIAEALGRLGVDTTLFSAVGDDDWGRDILRRTQSGGVNVEQVLVCKGERSAAYLTVTDENGERVVSIDNIDIMQHLTGRYLFDKRRLFGEVKMTVIDGNLSEAALGALFRLAGRYDFTLALDPTSVVLAEKMKPHLSHFYLVTPDLAEAEVLSGMKIESELDTLKAAQAIVAQGVKVAIVTMAEEGACYATSETSGRVPAVRGEIVDRIGVGDSLTAGVIFGLVNDFPIDEAVRLGVSAASLTLRCSESVCPYMSLEAIYDAMSP